MTSQHNNQYHDNAVESIILEEDPTDNYEPTNEEIIEYAKYLGFSLPEDNDLLYIAREGLKAPLPVPWKACQTKDGDIYYFNFETGASTWDHPLDEYYKKLYANTKKKNSSDSNQNKKNDPKNTDLHLKLSPELDKSNEESKDRLFSSGRDKNLARILENLNENSNTDREQKLTDGDMNFNIEEHQRRIIEYRRKKEEEHEAKILELDQKYKEKMKNVNEEYSQKLQEILADAEIKLEEEKENIKNSINRQQTLDAQKVQKELEQYETELRQELTARNEKIINDLKKENNKKLFDMKEQLAKKRAQKINEIKKEIDKAHEEEIQGLEKKINQIQQEIIELNTQTNSPSPLKKKITELEAEKRAYYNQQEQNFYEEKLKIMKKFEESTRELKVKELAKYEMELVNLQKMNDPNMEIRLKQEEAAFARELEDEYKRKLEIFQQELNRSKENSRFALNKKLQEYEKKKQDELLSKLNSEYTTKYSIWQKEKSLLDEKHNLDKKNMEEKLQKEFLTYKENFMNKMNEEIKELEIQKKNAAQRLNDISNIKQKYSGLKNITSNNPFDILAELQNKVKQMNEELNNKNTEIENLNNHKYNLNIELATLSAKLEAMQKESNDLESQSNCDSLNNLIDYLTKKLESKDLELKNLQNNERNYPKMNHNFNISIVDELNRNINESTNDMSAIQNKIELDKVFKELENLKLEITNERNEEETPKDNEREYNFENKPPTPQNATPKNAYFNTKIDQNFRNKKFGGNSNQITCMEKQIKEEINQLLTNKKQLIRDIEAFNKEFLELDLGLDMKSYYTNIKSAMEAKLDKLEKRLQNLQKFLNWTKKLNEDKKGEDIDNLKVNKTIISNNEYLDKSAYDQISYQKPEKFLNTSMQQMNRPNLLNKTLDTQSINDFKKILKKPEYY